MILTLLILAILILIGVMSLLETTREIEMRTRTLNDDNFRIESELEKIKDRLPKKYTEGDFLREKGLKNCENPLADINRKEFFKFKDSKHENQ